MKKIIIPIIALVSFLVIAATTIVPISQLPHNSQPTNGIMFLLTIPGYTNQWIYYSELKQSISTDSVVIINIQGNTNLQAAIASSTWFANVIFSNQQYIANHANSAIIYSNYCLLDRSNGAPLNLYNWPTNVLQVNNGFHLYQTFSNIFVTSVYALATNLVFTTNAVMRETLVVSNGASTNISLTYSAAGRKIGIETTNFLVIPSGLEGELEVEFLQNSFTNYRTRLQYP